MVLSIKLLKRVVVVYTHGKCPDGLASAMILKDAFRMLGTSPRIEFLVHGTPEHQAATDTTEQALFCDIAPRAGSGSFLDRSRWPIVLDHHKGAEELVRSFGELGVFADEKLEPGVSGAVLAFREVWSLAYEHAARRGRHPIDKTYPQVKDFADSVGARDTWQTKDVAEAIRKDMDGDTTPFVVAGFSYVVDKPGGAPRLLYSLRGLNGFDVAAFAKVNGGGGHTAAAGFHVAGRDEMGRGFKLLDPYHEVSSRLREFLRK